jgi:transglutaminase superfamily protein
MPRAAVSKTFNTKIRKLGQFGFRGARKFVSQPGEALLLCRMAWWVVVLTIAARCYSLPRALALVAGSQANKIDEHDAAVQERLARSIDLLLSTDLFLFRPICWKRAAVLHRYLLRNGITTRIIFGVRNEPDGKVAGHAWLEAEGEPILETTPPEYVVTYRFPSTDHFDPQLATITGHKKTQEAQKVF